jgi:7-cyano-7-deazaguanine synthase
MERIKTRMNEELLRGLEREQTKRVVLLYSGGVDSTAAGILLNQQGYEVYPLFIDYGQSSAKVERYLAETAPNKLGFKPSQIIETDLMKQLTKSRLLGQKAIDDSDAWVPGRNTLFMVIAGIYAKQIDADGISIGYMLDDNFVFGDNDYFHHKSMEELLSKTFLQPMEVFLPIKSMHKKGLIKLLHDSGCLDLTVSCWNAQLENQQILSCHQCANCRERDSYIESLRRQK